MTSVAAPVLLQDGHLANAVPSSIASQCRTRIYGSQASSPAVALSGAYWRFSRGLRRAPLTVLSPGPRLAGTPSEGKDMWDVRNLRIGPIDCPAPIQGCSETLPGSNSFILHETLRATHRACEAFPAHNLPILPILYTNLGISQIELCRFVASSSQNILSMID
jgi:hypothetical protein